MATFARTVVVLDQASGAPRFDEARIVGVDLHPAIAEWLDQEAAAGRTTVLALPAGTGGGATEDLAGGDADRLDRVARGIGASGMVELDGVGPPDGDGTGGPVAFVSADRALRGRARAAGYVPAAHPALLAALAGDTPLVVARYEGPRAALERLAAAHGIVPMHLQPVPAAPGDATWALVGIGPADAVVDAVQRRLGVVPFDVDPAVDDLVWARVDGAPDATREGLRGRRIVYAEPGQVLIALGPDEPSDALHLHGAHGHTELLVADPGLLEPALTEADPDVADTAFAGPSPILEEVVVDARVRRRIETARTSCTTATAGYAGRLDRYTGVAPLDAAGPIVSRHLAHPDNKRVEAQLLADLRAMGYCPWRHDFVHNGATHSNVIADLPGSGRFRIQPAALERLRRLLAGDGGRDGLVAELSALGDDDAGADGAALAELSDAALRRELQRVVGLEPWNPWWRLACPMAGVGAGLVIVGAHLDSTAGFDPGYSPLTDPAPGRDDNGSGLAAVLTLARHFRRFAGQLTHTVRFCFFNAEEAGLVGSKAYASQLKAQRAPVRAVFCMDMIGFNSDASRIFEVHAGYTDPAIRDLSVPMANSLAAAAAATGALLPAQVYRGTGYGGSPDRNVFDGAINRSDHAAFHQQGWGAVLASEDFFANLPGEPAPDANPNYHRAADQTTDLAFARAITCAIGRAATLAAL